MRELNLVPCARVSDDLAQPWPDSVLANVAEALLAAIYHEHGWPALQQAVARLLATPLAAIDPQQPIGGDVKNQLQNIAQTQFGCLPQYDTQRIGGSDHAPQFRSTVSVARHQASADGSNRKKAESAAATDLLRQLTAPT